MIDKVIIITGAAMGLGKSAAMHFAAMGAKLSLIDYNESALSVTMDEIKAAFPAVAVISTTANVANEQAVAAYVQNTMNEYGRIDAFYNNAGIEGRQAPLATYDLSVFDKVIDINLKGVYYGIRHVLPIMQKQRYGRVVNVSSVGGICGVVHQTAYVASKHAVIGMTKNAAIEYGQFNVMVNAIAPGAILTPMVDEAFKQMNPADPMAAQQAFTLRNPTKRLGVPADVSSIVAYLLSEENGYVNGQTIAVDGGESVLYGNPV